MNVGDFIGSLEKGSYSMRFLSLYADGWRSVCLPRLTSFLQLGRYLMSILRHCDADLFACKAMLSAMRCKTDHKDRKFENKPKQPNDCP